MRRNTTVGKLMLAQLVQARQEHAYELHFILSKRNRGLRTQRMRYNNTTVVTLCKNFEKEKHTTTTENCAGALVHAQDEHAPKEHFILSKRNRGMRTQRMRTYI